MSITITEPKGFAKTSIILNDAGKCIGHIRPSGHRQYLLKSLISSPWDANKALGLKGKTSCKAFKSRQAASTAAHEIFKGE